MASEQQADVPSRLTLDVLSLAKLQHLGVPHTDDSLKYEYGLEGEGEGRYGTLLPAQVTAACCGSAPVTEPVFLPVFPECRATVLALYDGQTLVPEVREGQSCGVVLDQTCFYSEQGGQSPDRGYFTCDRLQVSRSLSHEVHDGKQTVCPVRSRTFCSLWRPWTGSVGTWSIR